MATSRADAINAKTLAMFDQAIKLTPEMMRKEFRDVVTDLAAQSSKRAPIKMGFLRASIEPLPITLEKVGNRVRLVSGVAARQPYAFVQHEHEEYNHPKGGEAKYISRPLAERAEMYRTALAKAAMAALKEAAKK